MMVAEVERSTVSPTSIVVSCETPNATVLFMYPFLWTDKIASALSPAARAISKWNPPSVPVVAEFVAGVTNSATTGTDGGFPFEIDLPARRRPAAILLAPHNWHINRRDALGVPQ